MCQITTAFNEPLVTIFINLLNIIYAIKNNWKTVFKYYYIFYCIFNILCKNISISWFKLFGDDAFIRVILPKAFSSAWCWTVLLRPLRASIISLFDGISNCFYSILLGSVCLSA